MSNKKGFTLLEMLIFSIVIMVVLSMIFFLILNKMEKDKQTKAIENLYVITDALQNYYRDMQSYPTQEQGLLILCQKSNRYMHKNFLTDPWGRFYIYIYPGKIHKIGFDVISYGRDGKPGGQSLDKDLCNEV